MSSYIFLIDALLAAHRLKCASVVILWLGLPCTVDGRILQVVIAVLLVQSTPTSAPIGPRAPIPRMRGLYCLLLILLVETLLAVVLY
jgi:hypothetical protein